MFYMFSVNSLLSRTKCAYFVLLFLLVQKLKVTFKACIVGIILIKAGQ